MRLKSKNKNIDIKVIQKMDHIVLLKEFYIKYNLKNKTTAKNHIKMLLQTLPKNDYLTEPILYDLIKLHEFYNYMNPSYFMIKKAPQHNNYCFYLVLDNDKCYDFSYIKCFDSEEQSRLKEIKQAFRDIIHPQIKAFKNKYFEHNVSLSCPFSNITLYNNSFTHVDHEFNTLPFSKLRDTFMLENDLSYKDLEVLETNTHMFEFSNVEITNKWSLYHELNASLQLIHYTVNMNSGQFKNITL